MNIDDFKGKYEGTGTWFDSAGKSMGYRIDQTMKVVGDALEISFRHDFDDGTAIDAGFSLSPIAPRIYVVRGGGVDIGHGHFINGALRYHLRAGEAVVEVGYHPGNPGEMEIFGSSTVNADGNYIAWCENLHRLPRGS